MEHGRIPAWFNMERFGPTLPKIGLEEENKLVYDLPFEQYLTDPDTVSSSGLKQILKSPQHFLAMLSGHFKDEEDGRDHLRFGQAAHMLILEPMRFKEMYLVEPEFVGKTQDGKLSTRSKEAQEKKKAWWKSLPKDSMVLTKKEMDDLIYMIDSLATHPRAGSLLRNGRPEVSGFFTDPDTGIRVRIRLDYLTIDKQGRYYISDLKTARDAGQGLFGYDAARLKYHMQLALYYDGLWQITGKQPEAAAFIALEKTPPYPVALYWLNDDDLDVGRRWYKFALQTLKRCLEQNDWPPMQAEGEMLKLNERFMNDQFPEFAWKNETE